MAEPLKEVGDGPPTILSGTFRAKTPRWLESIRGLADGSVAFEGGHSRIWVSPEDEGRQMDQSTGPCVFSGAWSWGAGISSPRLSTPNWDPPVKLSLKCHLGPPQLLAPKCPEWPQGWGWRCPAPPKSS